MVRFTIHLLIMLVLLLGVIISTGTAAENGIEIRIKKLNKQGFIQFNIESSATNDDCAVSLYAANNKKDLRADFSSAVLLGSVSANPLTQTVLAQKVPLISSLVPDSDRIVYVRANANCEEYTDTSRIKRLVIPASKSGKGVSSASKWLRKLKRRVLTDKFTIAPAFPALNFTRPVELQSPGPHTNVLYVVTQEGIIYSFDNDEEVDSATPFLDLTASVAYNMGEQGLLGLAFHPDVASNRQFYVNYTEAGTNSTVIARYTISEADEKVADTTEERLLVIPQPAKNHNGGSMHFGPDGYLYISVGDGGGSGDQFENGQDPTTLLGSILRIDVDAIDSGKNYAVPESNPFFGNAEGIQEEIFAYGFRNPWRISFDALTGDLWAGDVGQGSFEEVDLVTAGGNYGWNTMEGNICFNNPTCDKTGLTLPIIDYGRKLGMSITGGYVYRGNDLKKIKGMYVYADFLSGRIWALKRARKRVVWTQLVDTDIFIASFGIDAGNQLYVLGFDGNIYRLNLK